MPRLKQGSRKRSDCWDLFFFIFLCGFAYNIRRIENSLDFVHSPCFSVITMFVPLLLLSKTHSIGSVVFIFIFKLSKASQNTWFYTKVPSSIRPFQTLINSVDNHLPWSTILPFVESGQGLMQLCWPFLVLCFWSSTPEKTPPHHVPQSSVQTLPFPVDAEIVLLLKISSRWN